MASYIKSKVQQSLSFLLVLVIAFSVFSGVLFLNPSPSYAYRESDFMHALGGDKDLREADLRKADLRKADLSGADLSGADLGGADLREANLSGANLREANLGGADLSGADLREANLRKASADTRTKFPAGFDAVGAGVRFGRGRI
jgi:uncharacterized protein YjbI with pentapeptide repeats